MLPEEGYTGVQTHMRQVRRNLEQQRVTPTVVTPFSWHRPLTIPVFGPRLLIQHVSRPASLVWYRHWHEVFLRNALRRRLAGGGHCVIYAQGPLAARAALRARRSDHQRVVLVVHFRISQADEWADKGHISSRGKVFQAIRQDEREVIPQVDGIVYVSRWAREALLSWLPEAAALSSAVISNFVAPIELESRDEPLGDLVTVGSLEPVKNHRFMLRALAEANRAGRSLTLDVFGDGPCRSDLDRLTRSLGLHDQVRFRGYRTDVRTFLPRYRAYVHASYSESSSLAIIEALAAGLPIVAANIGPMSELFDDGVEGRFWPIDDPVVAARILVDLVENEAARQKAATAAIERFHRNFNADVIAPRLWSFLFGEAPAAGSPVPSASPDTTMGTPTREEALSTRAVSTA